MLINPFIKPNRNYPDWFISEMDKMFPSFCGDKFISDDIIFSNKSLLGKYKGKKILIVAGGPSTNNMDWDPNEYDFVWTMNYGFRNKKLIDSGVDLISIGPEVSIDNAELADFLQTNNPLVCFEMREMWRIPIFIYKLQNLSDTYDCFAYETKFLGKTGVGARLAILASFLEAGEVHFIGMDGPEAQVNSDHSFEPGKKNLPHGCSFDDMGYTMRVHQEHYDFLWKFLTTKFPNVIYKNIGHTNILHRLINV